MARATTLAIATPAAAAVAASDFANSCHRARSTRARAASAELVSLRTAEWNPFGCPEHPALRRGSSPGPCDCKVASKVECYDAPKFAKNNAARRFDCTPSWINEHKVIC